LLHEVYQSQHGSTSRTRPPTHSAVSFPWTGSMTVRQETVHASGGDPRVPCDWKVDRCVGCESPPYPFGRHRHTLVRIVGSLRNCKRATAECDRRLARPTCSVGVDVRSQRIRDLTHEETVRRELFSLIEKHPRRIMRMRKWATTPVP